MKLEGDILSGWTVLGDEEETLLKELGLAHDVGGWGVLVDQKLINKVGEKFSYAEAVQYVSPLIEKEESKKVEKEKIIEEAIEEAIKEAIRTRKNVEIEKHMVPCCDKNAECSADVRSKYVTPEGKIFTTVQHTW